MIFDSIVLSQSVTQMALQGDEIALKSPGGGDFAILALKQIY